jgi:hypothetical protein
LLLRLKYLEVILQPLEHKKVPSLWPRSTMDSIRVSEAPDPGSIPGEATSFKKILHSETALPHAGPLITALTAKVQSV